METTLTAINTVIFFSLAAIHLYWLAGGESALDTTIPTDSKGHKIFQPGRGATLIVALGLLLFGLCNLAFAGWIEAGMDHGYIRYGILLIAIIFLMRAIGDFRYIGLTKRHMQSSFAKWDTKMYTPLCIALSISHFSLYIF